MTVFVVVETDTDGDVLSLEVFMGQSKMEDYMDAWTKEHGEDQSRHLYWYIKEVKEP